MNKIEISHPDKTAVTGAYSAGILSDGWLLLAARDPWIWQQVRLCMELLKRKPYSLCLIFEKL